MQRKNLFLFTLQKTLTSRIFGVYVLSLLLLPPIPLLLEYFTCLQRRSYSLNGRATLHMMDFSLYYVFFIAIALAVLIPFVRAQSKMALGDKLSSHKRTFLRELSLFCVLGLLGVCCTLSSYMLTTGILTPICAATRIDTYWDFTLPPFLEPFILSFFSIFSFIVLFLFVSSLCPKKLPAALINLSLWGISTYLYIPIDRKLVFPEGITHTQALEEQVQLYGFLKYFNPGSFAVEISKVYVFNGELMLRMLFRASLFTIPLLLITFLTACVKDHLAHRRAES